MVSSLDSSMESAARPDHAPFTLTPELITLTRDVIYNAWRVAQQRRHRFVLYVSHPEAIEATSRAYALLREARLSALLPPGELLELGLSPQSDLKHLWPERERVTLSWSSARSRLGASEAALFIDLSAGFNPDALAAALGVVSGGGLTLICSPAEPPVISALKSQLIAWPHDESAVTERLWSHVWESLRVLPSAREIAPNIWCSHSVYDADLPQLELTHPEEARAPEAPEVSLAAIHHAVSSVKISAKRAQVSAQTYHALCERARHILDALPAHPEQRHAVLVALTALRRDAFCATALGALRGRGKSSALGLIAAVLLLEGQGEVSLTAPSLHAVEAIFSHAQAALECVEVAVRREENALISALGAIRYYTPQTLWRREVRPRLLLVDEAAALPVPLLERLLEHKPKLVFATTTQGYEGTGRGFSLRFRPLLQRRLRKLYEPQLHAPLRWGIDDPLEAWMMRALLLDVDVAIGAKDLDHGRYKHQRVTPDELSAHPERLREIFGLLIHAHYRTQPSDLWRILDAPHLYVHTLCDPDPLPKSPRYIAVALVSREGELSPQHAAELYEGRIRARGQLFAANLALHADYEEGATLRLERVVRIASLPTLRGRGAGSRLLSAVGAEASARGVDLIGSSFGATSRLARFWLRAGFAPLRFGLRSSHVSGERSLLVTRALSPRGAALLERALPEAYSELRFTLLGPLTQLDPELTYLALGALSERVLDQDALTPVTLSERGWRALGAVIFGGRAYELAAEFARALTLAWLERRRASGQTLTPLGRLLIMKTVQGQRWLEVGAELNLSTSEAMRGLGVALELIYRQLAPIWALEWVARFPEHDAAERLCAQLSPLSLLHDTPLRRSHELRR